MSPKRWEQVRSIFESALDEKPETRHSFVSRACEGDDELQREVAALLASYEDAPDFLSAPLPVADSLRVDDNHDPFQGAFIGPWRLLRRLGSGGMAAVYLASRSDHEFHKLAAVKIVKPEMSSEEILNRFRTERQVLASLEHPNIARMLDGGTTPDGIPYVVMEYVDGVPIDHHCESQRISIRERLNLFRTVCSAVSYAHQNLVVHRDLKPSNIFVTKEGVPKLLDFGIAKLLRPEYAGEALQVTRATSHPMTPEYASPEQIRGDPITTATDIYSLGVLLFQLLTGELPYKLERPTPGEIERAICEWEPQAPSALVAHSKKTVTAEDDRDKLVRALHGDLDVITCTALRKEPARRYASVERFSHDIALHLRGEPVTARPDTWTYRAQKFLGRHRTGAVVTAIIAVALMGSTATAIYFATVAEKDKEMALNLSSFMLGDYDAAMQSGVTSARKAAMERVLNSLEELSPNTKDPALRELLFKAYIRLGDLQGNVYESNLGDSSAAKQSYEHALTLASAARSASEIAEATTKLGDVAFEAGDRRAALARYDESRKAYEQLSTNHARDRLLRSNLIRTLYKTGLTQQQLGDLTGALGSYRRELDLSQQFVMEPGASLEDRRDLAKAEEHVGRLLMQMDRLSEAQTHVSRAVEVYRELLNASPTSVEARSDWAMASALAAEQALEGGDLPAAEKSFEESVRVLDRLIRDDPNEQYHLWMNQIRSEYANVLVQQKNMEAAHQVTEALLTDLAQTAERTGAPELILHQYCWTLLTTPFKDLHNPAAALNAAQRANALTHGSDPSILHLLALAWDENSDPHQAMELEQHALTLLPAGSGEKRRQIEGAMTRFKSELSFPATQQ